ncbi:MAG: hypothetical protein RL757_2949 [Bacteroidota bacterium]|jgi:hypothetical protein
MMRRKIFFMVSLLTVVVMLGASCKSNRCNCPHFEAKTSK